MNEKDRPNFISIERQPFLADQLKELALLKALGYTRFKIVDQKAVMHQQPPRPALEGMYVEHQFEFDATGLFGEELPGPWLSYSEAIARNAAVQVQSKGFGLWRRTPGLNRLRDSWGSWYDFHAAQPIITDAASVEGGEDESHPLRTSSKRASERRSVARGRLEPPRSRRLCEDVKSPVGSLRVMVIRMVVSAAAPDMLCALLSFARFHRRRHSHGAPL